jgi:hypothetical protein
MNPLKPVKFMIISYQNLKILIKIIGRGWKIMIWKKLKRLLFQGLSDETMTWFNNNAMKVISAAIGIACFIVFGMLIYTWMVIFA